MNCQEYLYDLNTRLGRVYELITRLGRVYDLITRLGRVYDLITRFEPALKDVDRHFVSVRQPVRSNRAQIRDSFSGRVLSLYIFHRDHYEDISSLHLFVHTMTTTVTSF